MICFYEMFTGRQDNSFSLFSSGYRGEKTTTLSHVSLFLSHTVTLTTVLTQLFFPIPCNSL